MRKVLLFSVILLSLHTVIYGQSKSNRAKEIACERAVKQCQRDAKVLEREMAAGTRYIQPEDFNRCSQILHALEEGTLVQQNCDNQSSLTKINRDVKGLIKKFKDKKSGMCDGNAVCNNIRSFYRKYSKFMD